MTTGGDVKEINYQNDEVGSGLFKPKAGEANSLDLGGYRNTADAITSDGELMVSKNRKPGMVQILIANDMNVRKDNEKLVELANSLLPTVWTVTHINGKVYRGEGVIEGDIVADMDKATIPLKVVVSNFAQL